MKPCSLEEGLILEAFGGVQLDQNIKKERIVAEAFAPRF